MQATSPIISSGLAALVVTFGSGVPAAQADPTDVQRLEARVAELEALVRQLMDADVATPVATPAAAPSGPSSSYKFGGYIKADAIFSDYSAGDLAPGSAGTQFYIPATIPVGTGGGEGPEADFQARESRINFSSKHVTEGGDSLSTFIELDFFLSPGGDERISNSYNPRMRHAFIRYNDWTFGQTWSTFQDVVALPDNLDFIGPSEGTTFVRQDMIRYARGPWEFAVENPETTITPFGGGARIVTDDGTLPDLVARYTAALDGGYVKAAVLLRRLDYDIAGASDSDTAYGVTFSGKHSLRGVDDFRWMATYGSGIGRYLGLNTSNDAVLDASGELESIDQFGGFVSYRHLWNDRWRSNLTLSYLSIDNDTALTGTAVTREVYSAHLNLLFAPAPGLTIGGELIYASRELESGLDGDMTRFIFSAKYGF
ncbi:MAG: DcaP family trimeric outer membrane transporter [Pseudomonadota bacterium]